LLIADRPKPIAHSSQFNMKPSLVQGTRDFGPEIVRKRSLIFNTIRTVFELYGFQPLETPAMENLETLMGKYGEEGDKLIFKILNNGLERPEKHAAAKEAFEEILSGKNAKSITERALKYDLTIPFARYVAMNHAQLTYPFKRYQLQPVWRADKPQRGRYREFYQCDADVVGSNSLLNEIEFALIYAEVFTRLKLDGFRLHINNRKVLKGIMEVSGLVGNEKTILVTIDKADKIGMQEVHQLLLLTLDKDKVSTLMNAYLQQGSKTEKIHSLKQLLKQSVTGSEGINEMDFILTQLQSINPDVAETVELDLTLARGLDYYTGTIFEVKAPPSVKIGSIGGGGRYDNLTGLFGVPDIPGVGISFGVDRIYDVMEEMQLFPESVNTGSQALFFNLGEDMLFVLKTMQQLRTAGIRCELYHEAAKFDKQFKYAERKKIPFAIIMGAKEVSTHTALVKDLRTGKQESVSLNNLGNCLFI